MQQDLNAIRHVQSQDPLVASVTSEPTRALEARLQALEALLLNQQNGAQSQLLLFKAAIAPTVQQYDIVYFNPTTSLYQEAIASVTMFGDTFTRNPQSYALGVVWSLYPGNQADILIGGYGTLPTQTVLGVTSIMGQMLEVGQSFTPGAIYYLSSLYPGKVTQYPPSFQVQVLITDAKRLFVRPIYSNPDAVENYYRCEVGMRPVGGIRQTPKDQSRFQIVGFDALEQYYVGGNEYYRLTSNSPVSAIQQFGYLLADAYPASAGQTAVTLPTQPIYIRMTMPINPDTEDINIMSDVSLADISDVSPAHSFNAVSIPFPYIAGPATGGPGQAPLTYTIQDTNGSTLAMLKFNLVSLDQTYRREVYFKYPDSFQGWKMVNPPTIPSAIATMASGIVTGVNMVNRGTGYVTPPTVSFTGSCTTSATAVAIVNSLGAITSVTVTNGGTGYSAAPTVVFTSQVDASETQVTTPGIGYTQLPFVEISGPDFPTGTTAVASASIATGYSVSSTSISYGGSDYSAITPPIVTFSAPSVGGTIATATAHVNATGAVDYLIVTNSGNGYTSIPTVTIAAPGVQAVAGAATINGSGVITAIAMTGGSSVQGSGYAVAPVVTIIDTTGSGCTATANLTSGAVTSITVSGSGTAYTSPTITIAPPGATATGVAFIGSAPGISSTLTIGNTGAGYTPAVPPAVTFGSGAAAGTANVNSQGQVVSVSLSSGGTGYTAAPSVTIAAPSSGVRATAITAIVAGAVTQVVIINPGSGYPPTPQVTISGSSGAGATAIAQVVNSGGSVGTLSGFIVTNCGFNYSTPPTVTIAAPGTAVANATLTTPQVQQINRLSSGSGYSGSPSVVIENPLGSVSPTTAVATCAVTSNAVVYVGPVDANGNPTLGLVGGSGLTVPPTVTIAAPASGVQAQGIAAISNGIVTNVVITQGGSGYVTAPAVTFSSNEPSSNVGFTLPLCLTITGVTVGTAGTGYSSTNPPSTINGGILINAPLATNGVPALLVATVNPVGGAITGVTVNYGGYGYTTVPTVTFAFGIATISNVATTLNPAVIAGAGQLSEFTVTNPGNSYTSEAVLADVVTLAGGTGIQQTGTTYGLDPNNFIITGIGVYNGGLGSGGTVQALVLNNIVQRIAIENRGSGYSLAAPMTLVWPSVGLNTTAAPYTLVSGNLNSGVILPITITPTGAGYDPLNLPSTANGGLTVTGGSNASLVAVVNNSGQITGFTVLSGGTGYTISSIITIAAPIAPCRVSLVTYPAPLIGISGGIASATGTFTAVGGVVTGITITNGGAGYTKPPIIVFNAAGGGSVTTPACAYCAISNGAVAQPTGGGSYGTAATAAIAASLGSVTNPGAGYPGGGTLGFLDGGQVQLQSTTASSVSGLTFLNTGSGYMKPPLVTLVGGGPFTSQFPSSPGSNPMQSATVLANLDGEGGWLSPNPMSIPGTNGVIGYAADFPAIGSLPQVTPNSMEFYYNIKADPTLTGRWPSMPVAKTTFVHNGVEMPGNAMIEATGAFPYGTDVGFSDATLTWSASHPDGCPWDRSYQQLYKSGDVTVVAGGWDNVIFNSSDTTDLANINWTWWENTYSAQPYISRAWTYINRLSRYASSGKVASLSAFAPLTVINMDSGVDSSDSAVPMTGRLAIMFDKTIAASATPSTQMDFVNGQGPQILWQNTSTQNVCISSVILECVYQQTSVNVTVASDSAALISIGTAAGNYQDVIGQPIDGVAQGISCCLLNQGQCKELFVDTGLSAPVIAPGAMLYLTIQSPASSPIVGQLVVGYVKAQVIS